MKTTAETAAEIVRLHYAEHWPVGTIATQIQAHPDAVRRVLGEPRSPSQLRPRIFEPYRPFIDDQLGRYPTLLATRLYDMVRERGYRGSVRTLRKYVALVRPRPKRQPYLMIETLPGEQAQVDWAYVGKIPVAGGERAIWLFVIASRPCRSTRKHSFASTPIGTPYRPTTPGTSVRSSSTTAPFVSSTARP